MWVQVPPSVQRVPGAIWQTRIVQADVFQGSSPWEPTKFNFFIMFRKKINDFDDDEARELPDFVKLLLLIICTAGMFFGAWKATTRALEQAAVMEAYEPLKYEIRP